MDELAVQTSGLTKRYGDGDSARLAVDRVELTVRRGEVYGFLGPNGAGKTTTLRMVLGLIRPTAGSATVLGLPSSSKCYKRGKLKFKLKAPAGTKVVSATVAVNGKIKARLKGKKVRKAVTLKRLRKTATVTVAVKVTGGRTYIGSRAYAACAR